MYLIALENILYLFFILPFSLRRSDSTFFLGGVWGSNPRPYIYYVLSLPIELSSRGRSDSTNIREKGSW